MPNVVVSGSEVGLTVKWIRTRVEIPMEVSGIVILRLGERVLRIDLEGVRKLMLYLCKQGIVRTVGVIGETLEILNLRVEVRKIKKIKILIAGVMATQAALVTNRDHPVVAHVVLSS